MPVHRMALRPSLLLQYYLAIWTTTRTVAGVAASGLTLSSDILAHVPSCARSCLQSYVDTSYGGSSCGTSPSLACLCQNTGSLGYTLGEGAVECILLEQNRNVCSGSDTSTPTLTAAAGMCSGVTNAAQATHSALVFTVDVPAQSSGTILFPSASMTTTTTSKSSSTSSTSTSTSAAPTNGTTTGTSNSGSGITLTNAEIIGICVGGVAVVAAIGVALVFIARCVRRRRMGDYDDKFTRMSDNWDFGAGKSSFTPPMGGAISSPLHKGQRAVPGTGVGFEAIPAKQSSTTPGTATRAPTYPPATHAPYVPAAYADYPVSGQALRPTASRAFSAASASVYSTATQSMHPTASQVGYPTRSQTVPPAADIGLAISGPGRQNKFQNDLLKPKFPNLATQSPTPSDVETKKHMPLPPIPQQRKIQQSPLLGTASMPLERQPTIPVLEPVKPALTLAIPNQGAKPVEVRHKTPRNTLGMRDSVVTEFAEDGEGDDGAAQIWRPTPTDSASASTYFVGEKWANWAALGDRASQMQPPPMPPATDYSRPPALQEVLDVMEAPTPASKTKAERDWEARARASTFSGIGAVAQGKDKVDNGVVKTAAASGSGSGTATTAAPAVPRGTPPTVPPTAPGLTKLGSPIVFRSPRVNQGAVTPSDSSKNETSSPALSVPLPASTPQMPYSTPLSRKSTTRSRHRSYKPTSRRMSHDSTTTIDSNASHETNGTEFWEDDSDMDDEGQAVQGDLSPVVESPRSPISPGRSPVAYPEIRGASSPRTKARRPSTSGRPLSLFPSPLRPDKTKTLLLPLQPEGQPSPTLGASSPPIKVTPSPRKFVQLPPAAIQYSPQLPEVVQMETMPQSQQQTRSSPRPQQQQQPMRPQRPWGTPQGSPLNPANSPVLARNQVTTGSPNMRGDGNNINKIGAVPLGEKQRRAQQQTQAQFAYQVPPRRDSLKKKNSPSLVASPRMASPRMQHQQQYQQPSYGVPQQQQLSNQSSARTLTDKPSDSSLTALTSAPSLEGKSSAGSLQAGKQSPPPPQGQYKGMTSRSPQPQAQQQYLTPPQQQGQWSATQQGQWRRPQPPAAQNSSPRSPHIATMASPASPKALGSGSLLSKRVGATKAAQLTLDGASAKPKMTQQWKREGESPRQSPPKQQEKQQQQGQQQQQSQVSSQQQQLAPPKPTRDTMTRDGFPLAAELPSTPQWGAANLTPTKMGDDMYLNVL